MLSYVMLKFEADALLSGRFYSNVHFLDVEPHFSFTFSLSRCRYYNFSFISSH